MTGGPRPGQSMLGHQNKCVTWRGSFGSIGRLGCPLLKQVSQNPIPWMSIHGMCLEMFSLWRSHCVTVTCPLSCAGGRSCDPTLWLKVGVLMDHNYSAMSNIPGVLSTWSFSRSAMVDMLLGLSGSQKLACWLFGVGFSDLVLTVLLKFQKIKEDVSLLSVGLQQLLGSLDIFFQKYIWQRKLWAASTMINSHWLIDIKCISLKC